MCSKRGGGGSQRGKVVYVVVRVLCQHVQNGTVEALHHLLVYEATKRFDGLADVKPKEIIR